MLIMFSLVQLRSMNFIFIQERMEYVSPSQVALTSPFPGVQTYLFALPSRFAKHKDLWFKLAIPSTFSTDQLLDMLQKIRDRSIVVDDNMMQLVVAVLTHLAGQQNLSDQQKEKLLVPTVQNTLVHPHTCVYPSKLELINIFSILYYHF